MWDRSGFITATVRVDNDNCLMYFGMRMSGDNLSPCGQSLRSLATTSGVTCKGEAKESHQEIV